MLHRLDVELGASPVATLGVPIDGVSSSHTDPLGNGTVLLLSLAENALGLERLIGRLNEATMSKDGAD